MDLKKKPNTLTPGSEELRKATGIQGSLNGSDIVRAGAILGTKAKADVVVINHHAFSTSSYGYEGKAIMVNTVFSNIPVHDRLVGPGQINLPGNTFVVLKPIAAKNFLKIN